MVNTHTIETSVSTFSFSTRSIYYRLKFLIDRQKEKA